MGKGMAKNAIDIVREAEAEAEKILLEAVRESERITGDARTEAAQAAGLAEAAAKAAADKTIGAARRQGRHALMRGEAALQEEFEALRRQAGSRQAQAIEAVVSSLV